LVRASFTELDAVAVKRDAERKREKRGWRDGVIELLEKLGKVDRLNAAEQALTIATAEICRYDEKWFCF